MKTTQDKIVQPEIDICTTSRRWRRDFTAHELKAQFSKPSNGAASK